MRLRPTSGPAAHQNLKQPPDTDAPEAMTPPLIDRPRPDQTLRTGGKGEYMHPPTMVRGTILGGYVRRGNGHVLQGYLAHKKQPTPLGPP